MAFGDFVVQQDLDLHHPARRHLRHHGRQRLRQEHAAAPPDRAAGAGRRQGLLRPGSLWDAEPAARKRILRRTGVLYQSGALFTSMTLAENVSLPLRPIHNSAPARDPRHRLDQAGSGRPRRLRGLLSLGDLRRHDEARRPRPRHGTRSGNPILRRAVGRARSDHLARPRRPDPASFATILARPSLWSPMSCRASSPLPTTRSFSTTSSERQPRRAIPRTWCAPRMIPSCGSSSPGKEPSTRTPGRPSWRRPPEPPDAQGVSRPWLGHSSSAPSA